jgi:hypothetical protein
MNREPVQGSAFKVQGAGLKFRLPRSLVLSSGFGVDPSGSGCSDSRRSAAPERRTLNPELRTTESRTKNPEPNNEPGTPEPRTKTSFWLLSLVFVLLLCAPPAWSSDRFAVVISGASGGAPYAEDYERWRGEFAALLRHRFGYPEDHLFELAERAHDRVGPATRDGVREVFSGLRHRTSSDDWLLVLLVGHGSSEDGDDAKFNLVGPDLSASEWAALLRTVPGHLVFVNTASGSFPFLQKLSGPGRIVMTATDSAAQTFETVFPEYFISAFTDPDADQDKDGRISLWEAFFSASAKVQRRYEQQGELPTERATLDEGAGGPGLGSEHARRSGGLARSVFLERDRPAVAEDEELRELRKEQADLETRLESLKARKPATASDDYDRELEALLVQLARVASQIRGRT